MPQGDGGVACPEQCARNSAQCVRNSALGLQVQADMWVEAVVLQEDLAALLRELLPATIRLGKDGQLSLAKPTGVALVADVGLRVICAATLRWEVLGIDVPFAIPSLAVLARPELETFAEGRRLVFKIQIDHADVAGLPGLLDDGVTKLVNRELSAKHVELSWDYDARSGPIALTRGADCGVLSRAVTRRLARRDPGFM